MSVSREKMIQELEIVHEYERRQAEKTLLDFAKFTDESLIYTEFHKVYYKILDLFAKGVIKRLIISAPPQHGKSEGSSRKLPAYMLGINPDLRIAIGSYGISLARDFNRDCQKIISSEVYKEVFPKTVLNESNVVTVSGTSLRNSDIFEIVGKKGLLRVVGRGGPLTGKTVDVMIMDDLYKDDAEGNSPVIRETSWRWYTKVVQKRYHNDTQELIVFTRWHEDDIIGRIENKYNVITPKTWNDILNCGDNWVKINFEAIKESENTDFDTREKGAALFPERHNLKKLNTERLADPIGFNCMNQGNPISKEGLLYSEFKTYTELPNTIAKKNYTDTADMGDDYLCSICYEKDNQGYCYITDILYTQDPMELTEVATADIINKNDTREADIESNNGGRGFARNVEKLVNRSKINWFHQSKNKESRILTNAATVSKYIIFPNGWEYKYPEFHRHITSYKRMFKANKYDDCADTLTGIIEKSNKKTYKIHSA